LIKITPVKFNQFDTPLIDCIPDIPEFRKFLTDKNILFSAEEPHLKVKDIFQQLIENDDVEN
jgi:hypothetical protein